MNPTAAASPNLHDLAPPPDGFRQEILDGLLRPLKQLPCKWLYDHHGSELFERICHLPEYYPTRTELDIMRRGAAEMSRCLGPRCLLVEYGSGSGIKTRILLDHLDRPAGYVPIDISRSQLVQSAAALAAAYPRLEIRPVCADYTQHLHLPRCATPPRRTVVYFPGSTIGNFEPHDAADFLRRARDLCGDTGGLLIGVDLKKDPRLLHAAYNDSAGITAQFNLNLLLRINRELDGTFAPDRFSHYAFYNAPRGRIEMHLVSLASQLVHVAGQPIRFDHAETIFTESSYKYTIDEFSALATSAGFRSRRIWLDENRLFSVQYLTAQ